MFGFQYCLCVVFERLMVDIACSQIVYILIRDSYSGQINGTNQSYAHLYVCVCLHLCRYKLLLGVLFALLCLMCSDTFD